MAYESRILVVQKSSIKGYEDNVKDFYWCEQIASINLCRIDGEILEMIKSYPDSDCYIWDGENSTATDKYGDRLKELPLNEALKVFIHAKNFYDYRRYAPLVGLLMGFDLKEWGDLVVLHYGY